MNSLFPFLNSIKSIVENYGLSLDSIRVIIEDNSNFSLVGGELESNSNTSRSEGENSNEGNLSEDENNDSTHSLSDSNTILLQSQVSSKSNNLIDSTTVDGDIEDFSDIETFGGRSESIIIDVILKICYSILSGEALKSEQSLDYIKLIISEVENLISLKSSDLDDTQNAILLKFVEVVKFCLNNYYNFLERIYLSYSNERIEHYFVLEPINNKFFKNINEHLYKAIKLLFTVINISFKDLNLTYVVSEFQVIKKLIEDNLNDLEEFKEVVDVIKIKANFLIYKWNQRFKKDSSHFLGEITYRKGDEMHTSASNEDVDVNIFSEWKKKINYHYDDNLDKSRFEIYCRKLLAKNVDYSKLKLFDIHTLIKYYKDISPSEKKLKTIVTYLLKYDSSKNSKYDQYCLSIISNYAVNNYFSLISENKSIDLKKYDDIYRECYENLYQLNNNYFLQQKYLDFVLDYVGNKINQADSNSSLIDIYNEYNSIIEKQCTVILDEYYRRKEWAKKNHNFIFLLPVEESILNIENINPELKSLIVFTSFVLPLDINKIELDYSLTRQKLREVKTQLKVIGSLRKDLNELKSIKDDFRKIEGKNLEIIGVFTAIITFVLSSIPAFKFISSIYQAILFTLAMASSLGLFVLIIFSFTRGFSNVFNKERNYILFFVIVLLFIVTGFSLISFENQSVNGLLLEEQKYKDGLKIIDSVKTELRLNEHVK
ncbi:hypothetical protein [Sphingobacterium cavernae]|uniref:hypothetical protein n=1 Tax=Sphingobacterium cavernae TaxID=2592657 RepID=UPI00122FF936|nr:hypothetical protein [Sphingobacterium cavernae]